MDEVLPGEYTLNEFLLAVTEEGPMLGEKDVEHHTRTPHVGCWTVLGTHHDLEKRAG